MVNPFSDTDYKDLTDSQKAAVDAYYDNAYNDNDNDGCVCGVKDCPDAYAHTTSGF